MPDCDILSRPHSFLEGVMSDINEELFKNKVCKIKKHKMLPRVVSWERHNSVTSAV
jgi:hypothetical protein